MAITVTRKPFSLVPAHNEIWFEFTSTETAQPNFKYYITISEANFSNSFVFRVDPDTINVGYFNAREVVEKFISNNYPFGYNGWTADGSGINTYTINIGEEYGATPTIYTGTNYVFRAWNAALTKRERADYLPTDYDNTTTGPVWLNGYVSNSTTNTSVKRDQDVSFQFLQPTNQGVDEVYIEVFDSTNSLINAFGLDCTLAFGTYPKINFNAGIESLEAHYVAFPAEFTIAPTAGAPLFDTDAAWYRVTFTNITGGSYHQFTIDEGCSRFYNKTLFYLNRKGGFDFINLYGKHGKRNEVIKTSYRKHRTLEFFQESHVYVTPADIMGTNPMEQTERALSITVKKRWALKSNWLTDIQRINLQDLPGSSYVFFNFGYADYQYVSQDDTEYMFTEPLEDNLVNLTVNVSEEMERRQPS